MDQTKMKKRKWLWIIPAAVIILAAAAAILFLSQNRWYDGHFLPKNLQDLDLRGKELTDDDIRIAQEKFPEAHIYRNIRIGESIFDAEDQDIITGDFSTADIGAFAGFYDLRSADVSACSSAETVEALRHDYPALRVFWNVELEGKALPWDTAAIEADAAKTTAQELGDALRRLPEAEDVTVKGTAYDPEEQLSLIDRFPDVHFIWDVCIAGTTCSSEDTLLDCSGKKLAAEQLREIEKYAALLPDLKEIDLTDCVFSEKDLFAFCDAHPEWAICWKTELFGVTFSMLDSEITFDDIPLTIDDAAQIEALLPYMPNLKKVNMLRCGISNEDMDALNRRHEDVEFVWMVWVYSFGVRTDATYFTVFNCEYQYPEVNPRYCEELQYCHDMIGMDLGHLHLFGDTYFFTCMPHLQYLVISAGAHSEIPELASLKELVYLEAHMTSFTDLTPLAECTNLKHLNIAFKKVKSAEVEENDIRILSGMTWLERLFISNNMYSDANVQRLRDALPNTYIEILEGTNSVGGTWRLDKSYFDMRDALHMYYMTPKGDDVKINPYTGEENKYPETNPFLYP